MPFDISRRSSGVSFGLYRGPPSLAAVIWAATPMFTTPVGSSAGPEVGTRQEGFEHLKPTRFAQQLIISL